MGSDNPFAAALTSISLQGGDASVPSASSLPRERRSAPDGDGDNVGIGAGGGGLASAASNFLTRPFGKAVGGLGAWTTSGRGDARGADATEQRKLALHHDDYLDDGILGEGLAGYEYERGGDVSARAHHRGDDAGNDVSARESELDRREARIRVREEILEASMARLKRKNWPPCRPILYHDINAEVPAVNRAMVRTAYVAWLLTAAGYLLNCFTLTLMFFGGAGARAGDWFGAVVLMLCGVPVSWWAWYRGLYNVSQRTQPGFFTAAAYGRFFVHLGFHLLVAAWMIAGLPVVGGMCAGVFAVIGRFTARTGFSTFLGFLALANVAVWSAVMALSLSVASGALGRFKDGGGVAELRRGRDAMAGAVAAV